MKTTFDLPEPLLRRAKAVAAHQGRPLRDLVAEAIEGKLSADENASRSGAARESAWKAFSSRLQKLPDGSYFNPESIGDQSFFESLEAIRADGSAWQARDPFAQEAAFVKAPVAAPRRKAKPA
jgi:hypothetical protein